MNYPESTNSTSADITGEPQKLVLDGTVHIEEPEDEPAPRVRGLIELLNLFLSRRHPEET